MDHVGGGATISKIIESFSAAQTGTTGGEHVEFELRFNIQSLDEYKALLIGMGKAAHLTIITRSVNIIKEAVILTAKPTRRINQIATMTYSEKKDALGNSTIVKDGQLTYSTKRQIDAMTVAGEFMPFKIAVSIEAPVAKFQTDPFTALRIKLRLSMTSSQFTMWRFDFTLAVELTNSADLAARRDALFATGLTADNFANRAPFERADALEFEVEFIGAGSPSAAELYEILDFIRAAGRFNYSHTPDYQAAIYEVAKLLYPAGKAENFRSKWGRKHLTTPPISLDRATYFAEILPNITSWIATIKADGEGVIGHISGNTAKVIGGGLTTLELKTSHARPTVYDAELVDGKQYIFDVYVFEGTNLMESAKVDVRIKYIPRVVSMLEGHAVVKEYVALTADYAAELKHLYERKYPYPVDGIIFGDKYKWKPPHKLTIDFLTMRAPPSTIGRPPHIVREGHDLYFLFCGMNKSQAAKYRIHEVAGYSEIFRGRTFYDYYPIQFAPPSAPIAYLYYHKLGAPMQGKEDTSLPPIEPHGRICEYRRDGNSWLLERIRADRDAEIARGSYFGNNIATAMSNWDIIQDPLTFDMLRSAPEDVHTPYFGETDKRYKPANVFSSFVKNYTLKGINNLSWVIDLATGRGADIGRWMRAGIKHALCIDADADALKELQRRHEGMQRTSAHAKTTIYVHRANLTTDHAVLIKDIKAIFPGLPTDGAPLVVCNMAIHYMCESDLTINNFVMLVDQLTAIGGRFIYTCYNGARIFELLGDKPSLDYWEEGTLKYSIRKQYADSTFHNFGQVIQPLLGCAGGIRRDEFLANTTYINKLFKARGFKLVEQARFDSLLEEFSIDNLDAYDRLSDADHDHVGLYDYVILVKEAKVPPPPVTGTTAACPSAKIEPATCVVQIEKPSLVVALTPELQKKFDVARLTMPPIVVLPTKDIKLALGLPNADDIASGQISHIVVPDDKKYTAAAEGWRVDINGRFEVVIEEVRRFASFASLFESLTAAQLGATTPAAFESAFRKQHPRLSKTSGLIAIKVRKL